MQSLWDMLPVGAWPTQPFVSPEEQVRTLVALKSQSVPREPWLVPRLDSATSNSTPAAPQAGPGLSTAGDDSSAAPMLTNGSIPSTAAQRSWSPLDNPLENAARAWKLAGLIGGWKRFADLGELPAPAASAGSVPKAPLPQSFNAPPLPPPAWQRPEPDWSAWSPSPIDGSNRPPAMRPDYSGYYPGSRAVRDIPRLFEALLPGSGNIVSGDWDRVTAADLGDVGLGLARSLPFFGLEGAGARVGAQVEANAVADAAGAARAAALRGTPAGPTGPVVGKLDSPVGPRTLPIDTPAERARLPYVDETLVPLAPPDPVSALTVAQQRGIDLDALSQRAHQFHRALDLRAQRHRTTVVLLTDGPTIIGGGAEKDLVEGQLRLLRDGEIYSKLPGADAELTALSQAMALFHRPRALVTTRPICPECRKFIESMGGILTSNTSAIFPPY